MIATRKQEAYLFPLLVRPLSKGGLHAWDNVRLAHRICNTKKCDREDILPIAAT